MKRFLAILFLLTFVLGLVACSEPSVNPDTNSDTSSVSGGSSEEGGTENGTPRLIAVSDQRNDQIVVLNMDAEDINSKDAIVWTWSAKAHGDVTYASKSNNRISDMRLRYCEAWGGYVVGVVSSAGLVAVVSYPEGKCLFNADASSIGPRSIEILPNGLVAVVGSSKGQLRLYSATSKTDSNYVSVSLPGAHGVLWDPSEDVLWALGDTLLNAYSVDGTRAKPTLKVMPGMGGEVSGSGHDIAPVYGNPDLLWVAYSEIAQFSKSKKEFYTDYRGSGFVNQKNVKSVNSFADGTIVMTISDKNNPTAGHNTDRVRMVYPKTFVEGLLTSAKKELVFDSRDIYKVRVFDAAYQ